MKPFLMLLLSPFIFSSCLVVKIYESPKEITQEPIALKEVHHKMIGSGKVIDLGENGSHEIMFFGKDESPKGFLFKKAPSDSSAIWIEKGFGLIVPGFIPGPYGKIAEYTQTGIEIGVTLGIWALGALVFTILAKTAISIETGKLRYKEKD